MTTAILAAERWLNNGPHPTRRPWRRVAVLALGVAAMLGLLAGFVVMMLLDTTLG